jgi:hypothetical protein
MGAKIRAEKIDQERNRSSHEVTQENGISTTKQAPRSISANKKEKPVDKRLSRGTAELD